MERLLGIRREDRRDTILAFATLTGLMASHAMMETARDSLFLARLDAVLLPWTYLAIAVLAVLSTRLNQRLLGSFDKRRVLTITLAVSAAVTVGLWVYVGTGSVASLFVVYVWAGLVATNVVIQFWLMLGDLVTVAQAKRLFGVVAAGGLVGATLGSAVAERIVALADPKHLLLGAAGILLVSGFVPLFWGRSPDGASAGDRERGRGDGENVQLLRSQPYLRRLLLLVLVSTVALTGVDYVFKAVVAEHVPAAELGTYFARFYLVVNAMALAVQLGLASWLLRTLGVNRALLVLPVLLMFGVAGVGAGSGLIAGASFMSVLFLKGADGSLRHSIHRTSTEVLFLPLPKRVRERFKALIDVVGQRGGQALASLVILGAMALGAGPSHLAMAIGLVIVLWIAAAIDIKGHYLELFRGNLREGTIDTRVELSELDLRSLETLVATLNSDDDEAVLAALDLLERHGRVRLIPALILYHPSREVVLRSLDLFATEGRADFVAVARRLITRQDDEVRAAALRAITTVAPDEELLRGHRRDESPMMRATALVGMVAGGHGDPAELERDLACYASQEVPEVRFALARAIRHQRDTRFTDTLVAMGFAPAEEVRLEVARAMSVLPDARYLPALLDMLSRAKLRAAAREALVALGPVALSFLDEAMHDSTVPRNIRRHLPRTIHRFDPAASSKILMAHLTDEPDGAVRFKILRALGRLRADDPRLKLDRRVLRGVTRRALERAIQVLDWRIETERAQAQDSRRRTRGGELLLAILQEKERNAHERIFRLLGLLNPREDFQLLYHGLRRDRRAQAGSRELLEHAVDSDFRGAVLALVDDDDDSSRLARAASALSFSPSHPSYEARLLEMLEDRSEAVQSVAAYHIAELGLVDFADELRSAQPNNPGFLRDVIARALEMLAAPTPAPTGGGRAV